MSLQNSEESSHKTPKSVINKANNFIISKVGLMFFEDNISPVPNSPKLYQANKLCIKHPTSCAKYLQRHHYLFSYRVKIPKYDFFDERIEFATDLDGNVIMERGVHGIPNCQNNDCLSNFFLIDKDEALAIAEENEFQRGIKEWQVAFTHNARLNQYIWAVSNTLNISESESEGEAILIDATTGEILERSCWVSQ